MVEDLVVDDIIWKGMKEAVCGRFAGKKRKEKKKKNVYTLYLTKGSDTIRKFEKLYLKMMIESIFITIYRRCTIH
jgi:hypothetical protein